MEANPLNRFIEELESEITKFLKDLLQEKHLYQSVKLNVDEYIRNAFPDFTKGDQISLYKHALQAFNGPWTGKAPLNRHILHPSSQYNNPKVEFTVPDIKIYCRECDRLEAFNSQYCKDCYPENIILTRLNKETNAQIFALSFLCQSCKKAPEFFMVYRLGDKLTLSGRNPIEYVDVPKVIPNDFSKYYSGALVAHQSGQTLAGLFLLRTFIEQWVRNKAPGQTHVDEELELYGKSLPEDFRSRFPSLEDLYSKLSLSIHKADASDQLFNETLNAINQHFEARKIFELK